MLAAIGRAGRGDYAWENRRVSLTPATLTAPITAMALSPLFLQNSS